MNYADFLKDVRNRFAVENNTGLERFLGLSNGYLSKFENGKIKDPNKLLYALAAKGFKIEYKIDKGNPIFVSLPPVENDIDNNCSQEEANKVAFLDKSLYEKANKLPSVESLTETSQKEALVVVDGGVEKGVLIPVIAQGLSAGFGFDYDEGEIIRYIKVPAWLARKSRDLVALPIYGESMEPTLSRGDLAVCDKGGFKDDGVYVLRDQDRGLMFCKRVLWLPGGWTIKSDNPSYEPMKVDDKAIEVIARVIAAIKEVK